MPKSQEYAEISGRSLEIEEIYVKIIESLAKSAESAGHKPSFRKEAMREYELSVLFHPDLELNLSPAVERVEKTIADLGGEITHKTEEGRKKLAYTIAGQDSAIFYYYDLKLEPAAVAKLDRALVLMTEVIRHLVVAADPKVVEARQARENEKKEKEDSKEEE